MDSLKPLVLLGRRYKDKCLGHKNCQQCFKSDLSRIEVENTYNGDDYLELEP
jgi:hypothetical protein